MGIRSVLARPLASLIAIKTAAWSRQPEKFQAQILLRNLKAAQNTRFGKEHGFADIQTADDFKRQVPVKDYEQLKPWFDSIAIGEANVLWPGKPAYLAKTSGTTS